MIADAPYIDATLVMPCVENNARIATTKGDHTAGEQSETVAPTLKIDQHARRKHIRTNGHD